MLEHRSAGYSTYAQNWAEYNQLFLITALHLCCTQLQNWLFKSQKENNQIESSQLSSRLPALRKELEGAMHILDADAPL